MERTKSDGRKCSSQQSDPVDRPEDATAAVAGSRSCRDATRALAAVRSAHGNHARTFDYYYTTLNSTPAASVKLKAYSTSSSLSPTAPTARFRFI